ncbi:DUF1697 domain-containing protein [Qipengyuania sp.]|uniref:DUF1697 domain-containing protein n=1 Tax=Qipengyuania sp. TaxID=2004515 RepID=UPI003AF7D5B1
MARYAALLGSINVGGNRLKMADLVAAMEKRGFANVETVVASGNVLFDHDRAPDAELQEAIAGLVTADFGIDTFAAVRTPDELESALTESPFAGKGEDKLVHVHFLADQPSQAQFAALIADHEGRGPEKLAPGRRALHIDYVSGVGNSKLTGPFIERRLGCKGTARNVRSLKRIIEKLS